VLRQPRNICNSQTSTFGGDQNLTYMGWENLRTAPKFGTNMTYIYNMTSILNVKIEKIPLYFDDKRFLIGLKF